MIAAISILAAAVLASLALVGVAIGVFYRRKFGESTRGWILAVGAGLGLVGQILAYLPGVPAIVADLVELGGAVFLSVGVFWLWFVMMGPER